MRSTLPKDDFAPGRFKVERINAAQAMLAIVKGFGRKIS